MKIRISKGKRIILLAIYIISYLFVCSVAVVVFVAISYWKFANAEVEKRTDEFGRAVTREQRAFDEREISFENAGRFCDLENAIVGACYPEPDEVLTVRSYAILEDSDGNVVARSGENVFLVLSDEDLAMAPPELGTAMVPGVYACPNSVFNTLYKDQKALQQNLPKGKIGEFICQCGTWDELLTGEDLMFDIRDAYVNMQGEFLPGRVLVFHKVQDELPDFNWISEMVTLDLTPPNTEGYYHIERITPRIFRVGDIVCTNLWLPVDANVHLIPDESFQAEAEQAIQKMVEDDSRLRKMLITYGPSVYPLRIDIVLCARVRDNNGKTYIQYKYIQMDNVLLSVYCAHYYEIRFIMIFLLTVFVSLYIISCEKKKRALTMQNERKMLMNMMAHDLKTPLTAVEGYSESIEEHLNEDKKELYIAEIRNNIAFMNEIITENLAISGYELDKKTMEQNPVDLAEICREAVTRYQARIDEKNLICTISGSCNTIGDQKLLQRVFDNLILNAIKYSVSGSEIQVFSEEGNICIRNQTSQEFSGNLKRLWEPFVRGDESRSGVKGTGIGLYIAKKIMDAHKWKYKLFYDRERKIFECRISKMKKG